jgi:hypothetical protein
MYQFNAAGYNKKVTDQQVQQQRSRLLRTHPSPYANPGPCNLEQQQVKQTIESNLPVDPDYSSQLKRPEQTEGVLGEYVPVYQYLNTTRDFLSTQGYNRPERIGPPAHVDWRSVYIDNGSETPLNIGIGTSPFDPPDRILFRLQPEQGRWVEINSYGGSPQYLWPFFTDAGSCGTHGSQGECLAAGPPRILANNANSFVIKQGVTGVNIITFQYPTFSAS